MATLCDLVLEVQEAAVAEGIARFYDRPVFLNENMIANIETERGQGEAALLVCGVNRVRLVSFARYC